jgi:hypothetical protein
MTCVIMRMVDGRWGAGGAVAIMGEVSSVGGTSGSEHVSHIL